MMTSASRTFSVSVPGAVLGGVIVGPESGRPLIAVHGGPGESHDPLRPHLDRLASTHRRVVYYDQRGGDRSPLERDCPPGDWRRHVEDLEALRLWLGTGAVDLLGFSWGALLALLFTLEHRGSVARLVLVSPSPVHAGAGERIEQAVAAARARPAARAVETRALQEEAAARDPMAAARARFVARVAPFLAEPHRAWDLTAVETHADVARAVWASLGAYDLRPRLRELRELPVLVVCGAQDAVTSCSIDDIATRLGVQRIVLQGCGHAPFFERPDEFVATVAPFLALG